MKKYFFLLFFIISVISMGQSVGDAVQNFGKEPGFNYGVNAIAIQNDGKILVGGTFTAYNGVTENRIIRLNADGSKDTSFVTGIGFSNTVNVIVIQSDGKILVGGAFPSYKGVTENKIIRLNADGSKDTGFVTGTGFGSNSNDAVNAIAIQSDGKILVGGVFDSYNGVTERKIIRLNTDGSKDTGFVTGAGFSGAINNIVNAIAIQSDGKILVGGVFTFYNGVTQNSVIRLNADGSKDTGFVTGTGFDNAVSDMTIQSDGKILVGGNFTTYKGVTEKGIIRLNADGSKDTGFVTGTGFNYDVNDIAIQSDGKILVGGTFTDYNGVTENRIIRLNDDGFKDTGFVTGTGFDYDVNAIAIQSDGKILVGGFFATYSGVTKNSIIRLNADGSEDTGFVTGTGFNNDVYAIAIQSDGKILVGGNFNIYKGVRERGIIRLNADGSKDTGFVTGTGFSYAVYAIAIQSDGKILVGGFFDQYNGVIENKIIRLNADGSKDTGFVTGTGFDYYVNAIAIQSDGKILVGGNFTTYKGATERRIIRLNTDGSKDTDFVTWGGFDNDVNAITIQSDGKILVGGKFTNYKGVTARGIIRLNTDGSKDTGFVTGSGFSFNGANNVGGYAIAIQSDGKILVGGFFDKYNGVIENKIIRLNADGSKDTGFVTGTGFGGSPSDKVNAIAIQSDGKILVVGKFTNYNGVTENCIIRLNADGSKDTGFVTGTGFNYAVNAIAIQSDGNVLVGGSFTTYKDNNDSAYLIKLKYDTTLALDNIKKTQSFLVYPNPVSDVLQINILNNSTIVAVKIVDLQGKVIIETTSTSIPVQTLQNGIYFVNVKTTEGVSTQKFIKQ